MKPQEALTRIIEHATDHDLPLVIVSCSGGARMMESGRRIGMSSSTVRCTKLPGCARAAQRGASMRSTYCSAWNACWPSTRPSSKQMLPRCAGWAAVGVPL